jgi:RHS repeat-associated protein
LAYLTFRFLVDLSKKICGNHRELNFASLYPKFTTKTTINNYTIYASEYLVVGANGIVTKHYYNGSDRVLSRLSGLASNFNNSAPISGTQTGTLNSRQIFDLGSAVGYFGINSATIIIPSSSPSDCETSTAPNPCSSPLYYFHPDHVGSSTFLSDELGNPYQFLLYLPFGETMAEQKAGGFGNRYKFNGKEQDGLSGLYDYGARFYDPGISGWLSVDQFAEKLPHASSYAYCLNNPINLIDPDGRFPIAPLLWWAGRRAVAGALVDVAIQVTSEWIRGGGSLGNAWDRVEIDAWQVTRSAGENLVKGNYTSVALSASGDMLSYIMDNEDWTWEGAFMAAGEGGLSALLGDKLAGEFLKKMRVKNGVIFSADLSNTTGKTRSAHRNTANKQLQEAMEADPNTIELIELYDPKATENVKKSIKQGNKTATRKNPRDTEWDHNNENKNMIDLRTKKNHYKKTSSDPGRVGGFAKFHKDQSK